MADLWKARPQPGERATDALADVRVVDLSGVGAFASMILADFGADVIRVAPVPGVRGKSFTTASRFDPEQKHDPVRGARFNALHRGQRSIALNLKDERGQDVLHRLVADADVVLESFRPGVVDRLGAGYEALSAINPRLVYCSLSGFGQSGTYRDVPGHDINYIALGGLLALSQRPGSKPAVPVNFGADFAGGGLYATTAILIALHARAMTGRGQHVDMAMSDGVMALLTAPSIGWFSDGEEILPGRYFLNGGMPWYEVYECGDGRWVALGCIEDSFYRNLCRGLELGEYADRQYDATCHDEFRARLETIFRSQSADHWVELLLPFDVPISPVLEQREFAEHPHIAARGMVHEFEGDVGTVRQIGVGPKLSDTPGAPSTHAPVPGEQTVDILAALGMPAGTIEELLAGRVAWA
ncbi:hypothetical protein AYO38_11175 [bacterium SCGC AG-212-C10]|nr:hypothetical protein AYO38_11175 [bacterium SCGC AG-212-C10]